MTTVVLKIDEARERVLTPEQTKTRAPKLCPGCGSQLNRWDGWRLRVNDDVVSCRCGARVDVYNMELGILPSNAKFLDESAVLSVWWYHATDTFNWFDTIIEYKADWVHLGTRYSANSRRDTEKYKSMYKMKLDADARVAPVIYVDENNWYPVQELSVDYDIVRYINRWESVGSISLMVRPEVLRNVTSLAL